MAKKELSKKDLLVATFLAASAMPDFPDFESEKQKQRIMDAMRTASVEGMDDIYGEDGDDNGVTTADIIELSAKVTSTLFTEDRLKRDETATHKTHKWADK